MKKIFFLFLFFIILKANSQNIWDFKELRIGGKTKPLDKDEINTSIDISSLILINLDKSKIAEKISNTININNKELENLINDVQFIQKISKKGVKLLLDYDKEVSLIDYVNLNKTALILKIDKTYNILEPLKLDIIDYANENESFKTDIEKSIMSSKSISEEFQLILIDLEKYSNNLKLNISKILNEEGIYLQMGATLYGNNGLKTPIHINGFDNIKPPKFYDPYDSKLALTDKQKENLKDIKKTSQEINEEGIKIFFNDKIKSVKKEFIKKINQNFKNEISKITNKTSKILSETNNNLKDIQNQITEFRDTYNFTKNKLEIFYDKYVKNADKLENTNSFEITIIEDISSVSSDINTIKSKGKDIINKIKTLKNQFSSSINNDLQNLEDELDDFVNKSLEKISKSISAVKLEFTGFRTIKQLNSLVVDYTEDILKLDIENFPEEAILDIKNNAGFREQGNNIILQVIASKGNKKNHIIQTKYFNLLKTRPHMSLSVGLTFTKNINDESSKFIASPSSNLLYRFGSKSSFYREYVDFGLGINIVVVDSVDNSFSIGAGPVFTIFKDIIQFGAGYNFIDDYPYYSVGVKIPFLEYDFNVNK